MLEHYCQFVPFKLVLTTKWSRVENKAKKKRSVTERICIETNDNLLRPQINSLDFSVLLELSEAKVLDIQENHVLALDCTGASEPCIEYRDNSSAVVRWLNVLTEDGQYIHPVS